MKCKRKSNCRRRRIKPESVQFDARSKVDKPAGVVRDVLVLGFKSRHGYSYTPRAMKEAVQLYEGVRVNVDHPERSTPGASRSYRDRFGKLKNIRFEAGSGLRGDFHYNKAHEIAGQFEWDAENDPSNCGFSHNARGPVVSNQRGELVCESIEAVRSVDLVADPATARSLYEGKPRMKIKRKSAPDKREVRAKLLRTFGREFGRQLLESLDPAAAATLATQAPAGGGGGGSEDANVEALLALVKQVLADPNIDGPTSIKMISKRLKALKEMIPGGAGKAAGGGDGSAELPEDEGDEDEDEDEDRLEDDEDEDGEPRRRKSKAKGRVGKEIETRLARLESREERIAVRELCESTGFRPTDKQLGLLIRAEDDETREDLIESWQDGDERPNKRLKGKAKSKGLLEGGGDHAKGSYKDSKEWVRGLVA